MFSFHKPKVYRSTTGCCICKAKSSSSRFTDSKKYEDDFMECFNLKERRAGEICNACVLLVKRWKKLPRGTDRNWNHVVDARAGPGTKSLTKFKSKKVKQTLMSPDKPIKEKIKKKHRYIPKIREGSPLSDEGVVCDERFSDISIPSSLAPSPYPSEDDGDSQDHTPLVGSAKRKPKPGQTPFPMSSFVDTSYWKQEQVCCGLIFRDECGSVLIDARYFRPCGGCRQTKESSSPSPVQTSPPASASDDTSSHYGDDHDEYHSDYTDDSALYPSFSPPLHLPPQLPAS